MDQGSKNNSRERKLRERIKKTQEGDERVVKAVEELKKVGIKILKDEEQEIEDRIVIKEKRIYVLEGELRGVMYHKWSLTICDGCFDTLKSSKMRSQASDKRCC